MTTISQSVKNEIIKNCDGLPACCKRAFLSAAIRAAGSLEISRDGMGFSILSENAAFVHFCAKLLKTLYAADCEIEAERNALSQKTQYTLSAKKMQDALQDVGILYEDAEGYRQILPGANPSVVAKECCARTFLRAYFVGSGMVELPESAEKDGYHLQMTTQTEEMAHSLQSLFAYFRLSAKIVSRKHQYVVYFKDSEIISDVLAFFGANRGVMKLQNIIAERSVRNLRNRQSNCISGNISKSVDASVRQVRAIETLQEKGGLDRLGEKLKEIALLRLANPTASLDELSALCRVSKSGVNHRLRKLVALAEEASPPKEKEEK